MVHAISQTIADLNQQSYQRLKSALALNLRRQIFIGICDDLQLRDRLVQQLEEELSGSSSTVGRGRYQPYPYLVSLKLSLDNPDPIAQISQWLEQNPPPEQQHRHAPMPAFQLVGVEHLSRHDASLQWLFLNHLRGIEQSLPALESTLLLWVTRPWSRMIPQAAPNFWRCRTAVFDFIGEPTPSISEPETFPIAVERSPHSASETAPESELELESEIGRSPHETEPQDTDESQVDASEHDEHEPDSEHEAGQNESNFEVLNDKASEESETSEEVVA